MRHLQPESEHCKLRSMCLWGINDIFNVCRHAGVFLSDEHVSRLSRGRDAFLFAFVRMNKRCVESGSLYWPAKPKIHQIVHIIEHATRVKMNPAASWCFQEEDNMQVLGKIAKACHTKSMETRALERWLCQYFS